MYISFKKVLVFILVFSTISCFENDGVGPGADQGGGQSTNPSVDATPFTKVSAGGYHTCALRASGKAYCWGRNQYGQLGDDNFHIDSSVPVAVVGGHVFTDISAGRDHTCALKADGKIWCWGDGSVGQLGAGNWNESTAPQLMVSNGTFIKVTAGGSHSCGVLSNGQVNCWGYNSNGELGMGSLTTPYSVPVAVGFVTAAVDINAGLGFTCAKRTGFGLACWGSNSQQQMGPGPTKYPSAVSYGSFSSLGQFSLGWSHGCAFEGTVLKCWGFNSQGQLGIGNTTTSSPTTVSGGQTYLKVSSGGAFTCAIRAAGTVDCWGDGSVGQLGSILGSTNVPAAVGVSETFSEIEAGEFHACGITTSGAVKCWGWNQYGEVGNGTTTTVFNPTDINF